MSDTPKKRFQQTAHVVRLREYAADPAIVAGFDAAIMQLIWDAGAAHSDQEASAFHWQLTGACRLREIFLELGLEARPIPKVRKDNLPHEV